MRGTLVDCPSTCSFGGIIPAYAGNTCVVQSCVVQTWDHPRVCGEHVVTIDAQDARPGSSPRMRGTQFAVLLVAVIAGIIPAYAGNTWACFRSFRCCWDHPRVCGEHMADCSMLLRRRGSSPRMRGTPIRADRKARKHGIIPAYAGNTLPMLLMARLRRDHPRVCGEHLSSCQCPCNLQGIIPAYAGNTSQ